MKLYYCETPSGNFGDDMNLWFWDELMPKWRNWAPATTMFGIGTLITSAELQRHSQVIVCGSGSGYGGIRPGDAARAEFLWVRGPRTAKVLGLDPSAGITDPAVMVTEMPPFAGNRAPTGKPIFIPHRLTANLDVNWDRIGDGIGARVVLPQGEAKAVIAEIMNASLVLAESMHAAILADAFRVPWIPVRISHNFNDFKWLDWADSMEVEPVFQDALGQIRSAYFFMRRQKVALERLFGRRAKKANKGGSASNPARLSYLPDQDREALKGLITRFSGLFEMMLIRDLRKALKAPPQLSPEGVLALRQQAIHDRVGTLARRMEGAA